MGDDAASIEDDLETPAVDASRKQKRKRKRKKPGVAKRVCALIQSVGNLSGIYIRLVSLKGCDYFQWAVWYESR